MLAYFHYCNKGNFPFTEQCKDADLKFPGELSPEDVQFVRWTREYAIEHSKSPLTTPNDPIQKPA